MTLADKTQQGKAINTLIHDTNNSTANIRYVLDRFRKEAEKEELILSERMLKLLELVDKNTLSIRDSIDDYYRKFQADFNQPANETIPGS